MKKNIKLIPLFLFLFVFQLLYFLSTIYTEKIDHMFLILAVFMILICILLYCILSDVLKKSNTENKNFGGNKFFNYVKKEIVEAISKFLFLR